MPRLAFVHGWAQSAQTWHAQVAHFSSQRPLAINLPGHGGAADVPLEGWDDALPGALPEEPVVLVGWSLGGMLSMRLAARHPERVQGLVLLSSTPCFRMRAGWPHGCEDEVFERFREALESNAPRLLDRFFALMLQGEALDRRQYVDIARHAVDKRRPPSMAGLRDGLRLLDGLNLREVLAGIRVPTLVIHGEDDAVTPVGAGRYLSEHIPGATLATLPGGHAPHLTRAGQFNEILEEWCLNSISTRSR